MGPLAAAWAPLNLNGPRGPAVAGWRANAPPHAPNFGPRLGVRFYFFDHPAGPFEMARACTCRYGHGPTTVTGLRVPFWAAGEPIDLQKYVPKNVLVLVRGI
jgi:hypothetical protein